MASNYRLSMCFWLRFSDWSWMCVVCVSSRQFFFQWWQIKVVKKSNNWINNLTNTLERISYRIKKLIELIIRHARCHPGCSFVEKTFLKSARLHLDFSIQIFSNYFKMSIKYVCVYSVFLSVASVLCESMWVCVSVVYLFAVYLCDCDVMMMIMVMTDGYIKCVSVSVSMYVRVMSEIYFVVFVVFVFMCFCLFVKILAKLIN